MTADTPLSEGFGDNDPAADPLASLLNDPRMASMIDSLVAARVAQMAVSPQAAPTDQNAAFTAFAATVKHLIDTQAMQQPGYIKPLPADEVDRRLNGKIEMEALLRDLEAQAMPPMYTVGENGFFECTNALEFREGDKIRTYLPPAEDFVPENEPARKVHAAMMRWLGGTTPEIGEQLRAAQEASKLPPLVTGALQPMRPIGPVELVDPAAPKNNPTKTRRTMGTIVPERREVSPGDRSGAAVGPAFADAV